MSYISTLSEPKLPWSWKRTLALFKAYFTGIVEPIAQSIVAKRKKAWATLNPQQQEELIAWTKKQSTLRRASMAETAARGSYIMVGIGITTAFSGAAIVAVIVSGATASAFLLLLGFTSIVVAICILCVAIGAKGKVLKRPRASGESEADERLLQIVAILEAGEGPGEEERLLYAEYEHAATQLHKRKVLLMVERRAQLISIIVAVKGFAETVVGLFGAFYFN